MISTDTATMLIGGPAFGPDGGKLGTVGQIYLDVDTGLPEWVTIRTGLFGTRENFAPLADGELTADGLQLPYDKDRIKGAPHVDAEQELSPEEETALYDYYGLTSRGTSTGDADGAVIRLPADYSWQRAMQTGELADITFLANGPLTVAVQRMGLGVRLSRGAVDLVSIGVDAKTFTMLKGEALMRPLTVVSTDIASFVMRDPFNVNWEIAVAGSTPLIPV